MLIQSLMSWDVTSNWPETDSHVNWLSKLIMEVLILLIVICGTIENIWMIQHFIECQPLVLLLIRLQGGKSISQLSDFQSRESFSALHWDFKDCNVHDPRQDWKQNTRYEDCNLHHPRRDLKQNTRYKDFNLHHPQDNTRLKKDYNV
jgi:hypothetical protein